MAFKYTNNFSSVGGYNTPQPGMTYTGKGKTYYGNDGFIYNMQDGSRRPGNPPPTAPKPPPPKAPPVSQGYKPPPKAPSKPAAPPPKPTPVAAPVTPEEIADITPPPLTGGLEDTIKTPPPVAPELPTGSAAPPVGYIANNPSKVNKFLTKKKKKSVY